MLTLLHKDLPHHLKICKSNSTFNIDKVIEGCYRLSRKKGREREEDTERERV